jgi:hypothetical protein
LTGLVRLFDLPCMKRGPALIIAIAVLAAAAGLVSVARTLQHPGALADMRANMAELRMAVDSCQTVLAAAQSDLLAYTEQIDSLRTRVREMEALHPSGVPADSYDIYLQLFNQHNDSVTGWDARVQELQQERERCIVVTELHNQALDSLRILVRQQR